MKKLSIILSLTLAYTCSYAQPLSATREYINRFRDIAIAEEQRTGVPAAITLAQGILEAEAGKSDLVRRSNNHFGIKCKTEWTGERVYHDDDARGECFRKYDNPEQSYRDHSDFLRTRAHYSFLFKLDPTDYEGWAYGLKRAGYATNPKYPQLLIRLIREYDLQEYTLMALGRKPIPESGNVVRLESGSQNNAVHTVASASTAATPAAPAYPQGVFQINGTRVVYISKGTSYRSIAQQHNLSLEHLYDFNDMEPAEAADADHLLFLGRKRRTGATDLHRTVEGERLFDVAQREGVRFEDLLTYNGLDDDRTFIAGELIALSPSASKPSFSPPPGSAPAPVAQPAVTAYLVHRVQPKETLYSIAKKYGVRTEDILQWNNLPTSGLKIGQELRINKK
ncbi:glucosaminidase domain-containing protein [Flaviaesturariibacter amylovorans]|uniref:Peptidoglycan hydrolase n=1 Tax=Flaviaesturariibacter amylovorans TaxID=1084520 RepID=A0ABP8HC00_9BACT